MHSVFCSTPQHLVQLLEGLPKSKRGDWCHGVTSFGCGQIPVVVELRGEANHEEMRFRLVRHDST